MKVKKIAVIGHFGGNEVFYDGQTIKTKVLCNEIQNATDWKIKKVDTYYKSKSPIKLLIKSIWTLLTTKRVIVLLSGNGMKFYFPILSLFSKLYRSKVYHDVVGGNIDEIIKRNPKFLKYLNSFRANWVETESLLKKVEEIGIKNARVVPNFKRLNVIKKEELSHETGEPFRFCTFSRVMKEKGIEDAVRAIEDINSENGRIVCTLDIYGKVDDGYVEDFDTLMSKASDAIKYNGVIPFTESVGAISDKFALLFPTFWGGEGFPGTIVDAYSAGLPVIASDWNCNYEVVQDKVTGILYPNGEQSTLKDSIEWFINNVDKVQEMRFNCIDVANSYQPDNYIATIISELKGEKR